LNAGLTWQQLGASDRDAFAGPGEKVLLKAGFRLFKFTEGDITSANPVNVTPWWSPMEAYQWDAGLKRRLNFAKQMGICPSELTRVVAAVRTNWNGLTNVLTAILQKDVWAFWGRAGGQPQKDDRTLEDMRSFDKVIESLSGQKPQRPSFPGGAVSSPSRT
jgi:hypothetical protein